MKKKYLIIFISFVFYLTAGYSPIFAQTETPTVTPTGNVTGTPTPASSNPAVGDLKKQIDDLQNKINDLKGQENTLSNQIGAMDSQIKLTELRIDSTETQIKSLTDDINLASHKISHLETSLSKLSKVLFNRVVSTYEVGTAEPIQVLMSSKGASDFFFKINYLRIVQDHDKKLLTEAQQAKDDYENQKEILEDKKKKIEALKAQLESYTKQLDADKQNKKALLAQTQGSEANYQRLLAQAKAQLASFSNFTANFGGASLLGNQTVCDDWGCYYNQRDSQWGGNSLNGTGYTIASDGCLVTSMAMVITHFGQRGVTPQTINSNSSNFASYYPAYLNKAIAGGTREPQPLSNKMDVIDNLLKNGPIIVGINAYGGTHFVVILSGSGGNYTMNDPYIPSGHKISFTDNYSINSIFEIDKVSP